jgi:ATP-dependent helicase/nuclease subunit A
MLADGIASFLAGPYARAIRQEGRSILREEPFVFTIQAPAAGRAPPRSLAVRGSVDLIIDRNEGPFDIIAYKTCRPRADLSPYEVELRAYSLAIARRSPDRPVRAGVVYLGSSPEPVLLRGAGDGGAISAAEHDQFQTELEAIAHRYAEARHLERFEGVPPETCKRLSCGFINACHGERRART